MPSHATRTPVGLHARWQPAALVTWDIVVLKVMLGLGAIIRAEDYAHGAGDRFGILEAALPLWIWSLGSYTVGALVLVGISWRRHFLVWLGHALGAGLYGLLAVAAVGAAFDGWPPTGARAAVPFTVWVIMCAFVSTCLAAGALTASGPLRFAQLLASGAGITVLTVIVALAGVPADGLRGVMPLSVMAVLHLLFMLRSGPRPLADREDTRVVEETTAPEST